MTEKHFETIELLIKRLTDINREKSPTSKILYRGQADSSWKLTSTLERCTGISKYPVEKYEQQLAKIQPEINALTSNDFSDDSTDENEIPTESDRSVYYPKNPAFMVYARQHGYPTPILDWTESLYIALFFALQTQSSDSNKSVAIYTYVVDEANDDNSTQEFCLLPLKGVNIHKRHFIQQARYAYSVGNIDKSWCYISLEETMQSIFGDIEKFTVPLSQKSDGLDMLASMNITPFTLYGTEESLMDSLAWKNRKGLTAKTTFETLALELANSSSYAETHRIIEQCGTCTDFNAADTNLVNYMLNSARRNSQIYDILADEDVTNFFHYFASSIEENNLTEKNNTLYKYLQNIKVAKEERDKQ